MRTKIVGLLATVLLLATPTFGVDAQDDRRSDPVEVLAPGSRLWVDGGSTVRSWTCGTERFDGTVAYTPSATSLRIEELQGAVRTVDLRIPIAGLDCGNGQMDGHMRDALQMEDHPDIRFRMGGYAVTPVQAGARVDMRGDLTIAGRTLARSVPATVTRLENGNLRVQGSVPLDMTEFGVRPPRLMFGTLRVHDDVVVNFDLILESPSAIR